MRRYNIVSGILLIFSVTNIALAAPVPVQERRQVHVNVVHDRISVLGKRMDEEFEEFQRLAKEYSTLFVLTTRKAQHVYYCL